MITKDVLRALFIAAFILVFASPVRAEDVGGVGKLAWDNYNAGEFEKAYNGFSKLHEGDPSNADIALGLAFSAMKLGKTDEAMRLAERFAGAKRDFRQILQSTYFETANSAFEKKDWGKAEVYFKKLLAAGGDGGAKELLAWSLYNQGKYAEALPIFKEIFEKTKNPKFAEMIRVIIEGEGRSLNEEGRAWELYNKGDFKEALPLFKTIYAKTSNPSIAEIISLIYEDMGMEKEGAEFLEEVVKAAGKDGDKTRAGFLFKKNCPITAAQTYGGSDACYYNSHTPDAKASLAYRSKTGDAGTSRLDETSISLAFTYPFYKGNILKFELTPKKLSSGSAPANVFAGSYFRGAPQKNDVITSADVIEPRVSYEREGNIKHSLLIGSTPIGGEISPTLVFLAAAERKDHRFEVHRLPVEESILSYTGIKDPYGNSSWGRVVRTGAEAQYVLHPRHFYWASFKVGYDLYEGQNVLKNDAFALNAATGRTTPFETADLTAGAFASYKRFSKNLNSYTFGNGGYFSPQSFLAVGPFIRYQIRPCKGYWVDAQAAVSYLKYKTSNSKQYPLETTGPASSLELAGENSSGLGYSAKMDGLKAITSKWSAGWSAGINRSADYTEWKAGLNLRYTFEPRSTVQMYLQ